MIDIRELEQQLDQFATERDWEQFHTPKNLALAIAGEVGELCELVQWKSDSEIADALQTDAFEDALSDELADVLIYLVRLAAVSGVDLDVAVQRKLGRNAQRYPAAQVKGSAEKQP